MWYIYGFMMPPQLHYQGVLHWWPEEGAVIRKYDMPVIGLVSVMDNLYIAGSDCGVCGVSNVGTSPSWNLHN